MTSLLPEYSKASSAKPHHPFAAEGKCDCCPQEFHSEICLFEHEILCHNKTEFKCKVCQFKTSHTRQFRSHLAAHYVTSAVKAKSSLNNAEIPIFSQLQTSQDDRDSKNNGLASDADINLLASSDQNAPKNRKGRRPSNKLPRHPIAMDGRYMCRAPGCDFSTKYEFNLTRHEVRHKKSKGGGTRPKSTKTWRNSNQRNKKIRAIENNSYPLPKPLEEPRGIHKSVLLSPKKSLDTAAAAERPTEFKHPSESPKSVISSRIEDRKNEKNGENDGRKNDDDDHDDNYFKGSSGIYKCKKCYYTTSHKCNMKKHFPTHSNDVPYACRYCDYRSKWEQNVKVHERREHFATPRKSKTSTGKILAQLDGSFHCKDCDYMNKNKRLLLSHMRCHSDERPFPCTFPGCAYRSKWSHWARAHERSVHHVTRSQQMKYKAQQRATRDATYVKSPQVQVTKLSQKLWTTETRTSSSTKKVQTEAAAPTKIPSSLSINSRLSSTKPHHCNQCSYSAASKSRLKQHYAIHSTDQPFGCHHCEYRAKRKSSVKEHEKRHMNNNKRLLLLSQMRRHKGRRQHNPCTFPGCSYRSKSSGGIQSHERNVHHFTRVVQNSPTKKIPTHSSTEKVQCLQCKRKFYPRFLQDHLKVHCGGENSFGCSVKGCKYRTKWLSHLINHKTRCGYVFKQLLSSAGKKPSVVAQLEVDREVHVVDDDDDDDNEMEEENYLEPKDELVDSTGFACTLCDFVGYSEMAALNHAKCHTQPLFPTAKLNEIPIICLD